MSIWIHMTSFSTCTSLTWIDVIEAPWACRTVMGAQVRRHHTLMVLSQLAEARSVFSWLTAMSQISAEWPRSVARRRPSSVAQIFTRQSSEPWKHLALAKIISNRFFLAYLQNNCEQRDLWVSSVMWFYKDMKPQFREKSILFCHLCGRPHRVNLM